MSISIDSGKCVKDQKRTVLTVLSSNSSAKYCAPCGPIPLYQRLSSVNVCIKGQ